MTHFIKLINGPDEARTRVLLLVCRLTALATYAVNHTEPQRQSTTRDMHSYLRIRSVSEDRNP